MKNKFLVFALLLLPAVCFGYEMAVSAQPMDSPYGGRCKVVLSDYRPDSSAVYLGNCGWTGLKGIGAYVQTWNHSNHVKIVRGRFSSGKVEGYAKVTYINTLTNAVQTYEESEYATRNVNSYHLGDILADANQSGLQFDNSVLAYIKFANYIDLRE